MIAVPHPSPSGTGGKPLQPDGSVVITIPAPLVAVVMTAAVVYVLYLVLTSKRVGVKVPWRRLGWCLAAGAVAGAAVVGWFWKADPAKLAADAAAAGISLREELAVAAGGIALGTGFALFALIAFAARSRGVRTRRRRPRRAAPGGDLPVFPGGQPPYRPPGDAPPPPYRLPGAGPPFGGPFGPGGFPQ